MINPIKFIDKQRDCIIKTYHDLHSLAEPSWKEKKTSDYLLKSLKEAGLKVKTFQGHYGIVAEIPGRLSRVVALRADMDALLQEVEGELKPNHSCGHDAHSAMVLHTALAISQSGIQPKHTLRFIFQPAEEKGEGALKMIEDGALDEVTYLFGLHLRPDKEVPYGKASPVIIHGAAETIRGTIKGIQAHASRPEEGINAIEAAALLVQKLQQIYLDLPCETSYSIKMTQLQTENKASNVIPETASFSIDVRAQTNEVMNKLNDYANEIFEQTKQQTGVAISSCIKEFVPAAATYENAIKITKNAISRVLGKENIIPVCVSHGGEDFHFYTAKNQEVSATMIGLGCGLKPGLHHPQMEFNLEALQYGTKILTQTILLASEE
ncbi:amidohydrolase [Priestia megaterium]|jgi:amidohydrolase|uniref:amidohydrolase n=1 Tax=Priestia megaterium TaxID=1404 RepID=UPI00249CD95B|nr:amidohydrolase [Priestia megaterium]MDI3090341.1 amidohydrolase [Priestia megaterium]